MPVRARPRSIGYYPEGIAVEHIKRPIKQVTRRPTRGAARWGGKIKESEWLQRTLGSAATTEPFWNLESRPFPHFQPEMEIHFGPLSADLAQNAPPVTIRRPLSGANQILVFPCAPCWGRQIIRLENNSESRPGKIPSKPPPIGAAPSAVWASGGRMKKLHV